MTYTELLIRMRPKERMVTLILVSNGDEEHGTRYEITCDELGVLTAGAMRWYVEHGKNKGIGDQNGNARAFFENIFFEILTGSDDPTATFLELCSSVGITPRLEE